MAKVDIPYVQRFRDRHGRVRFYYRRPGYPRVKLPPPSEPGFLAAYEAAQGQRSVLRPEGAGAERTAPGTVSALLAAYYQSAEFGKLTDATKHTYRNMLDRFREKNGHRLVEGLTTQHFDAMFDAQAKGTPGAAANLRKRLRRVFRLAVKMGWRETNPITETDAPRNTGPGFIPWTEDDIAAFEKRWPSGTRERLAFALLLYTGVRRSDLVSLGRQHVKAGRIHVMPKKTERRGVRLALPIHPTLQREIDAAPPGMTFVLTQFGKAFTPAGFTQWFRERAEDAGLESRTPHGLRKACGRRLAEAGATAKESAAMLGHASLAEVERYARDADQARLADAAGAKLADRK